MILLESKKKDRDDILKHLVIRYYREIREYRKEQDRATYYYHCSQNPGCSDDDYEDYECDDYEDDECFRIDLPEPKEFISHWIGDVNSFLNKEVTRIYYDAHIKVPNKLRRDIEDAFDSLHDVVHKIYAQEQDNSGANFYEDEDDDRTDTRRMRQRERDE